MFYVKSGRKKIEIHDESVFTVCPECGREFQVYFLQDLFRDEDFDLCGTAVYCAKCSERRAREREQVL